MRANPAFFPGRNAQPCGRGRVALNIPPEAAWLIALGAREGIAQDGRRYPAASLSDEARIALGGLLIAYLENAGAFEPAELARCQLADRWPGHFLPVFRGGCHQ